MKTRGRSSVVGMMSLSVALDAPCLAEAQSFHSVAPQPPISPSEIGYGFLAAAEGILPE